MFPETLIEDMAIGASLKIDGCRPNTLVQALLQARICLLKSIGCAMKMTSCVQEASHRLTA
jgi:hypothetical protein